MRGFSDQTGIIETAERRFFYCQSLNFTKFPFLIDSFKIDCHQFSPIL